MPLQDTMDAYGADPWILLWDQMHRKSVLQSSHRLHAFFFFFHSSAARKAYSVSKHKKAWQPE